MKLHNLREKVNDWLDQPVKTGLLKWMTKHPKFAFGTTILATSILYCGIKDITLHVYSNYKEQAAIEQRVAEQKATTHLPRDLYSLADAELAAYIRSKPVVLHESKTKFDLEAKIGDSYNLFIKKNKNYSYIHLQSTKIKKIVTVDGQLASIFILDDGNNIASISHDFCIPFDETSPEGWSGEGTSLFEMVKPKKGTGLVINHYTIPGWGINELYPNLQFPKQYQTLVQEILNDMPTSPKN